LFENNYFDIITPCQWGIMKKNDNSYVLVEKLSNEIDNLENRIKHVGIENFKKLSIRNIKIFGRFMQMIGPYIIAAVIPFVGQSFLFDIPFYPEEIKQPNCYMIELDNKGIISYQNQYKSFSNADNIIYIYGKWEKGDDNYYHRTIKSYLFDEINLDELKELVNKKDLEIEDILGNPYEVKNENKNILTEEEMNEDSYIQAIYYYKDKDDYIIVRQPVGENIVCGLVYLFIIFITEGGVLKYRSEFSNFSYYGKVDRLKEKYEKTDVKVLEKKLEVKKNSLSRLIGEKYGK
jgi:hypothetical protein